MGFVRSDGWIGRVNVVVVHGGEAVGLFSGVWSLNVLLRRLRMVVASFSLSIFY